ncbi:MAG: 4'-phosphopantetheinyl transferase superfamily protein, partial [Clostridiales Family XIII bacterium]|nr:4'-phosphopantetheinyl transferase superfamily protein [Clostridiales Family XIII bacterium]
MTKIYIYTYDTHEARDDARDRFFRACLTDYLNTKGNTKGTFFFVSQGSIPEEAGTQKEPSLLCTFGEHGKPRFAAPELADVHFSVSHSGDYLAIAFSEQEVGVDVEHTSRRHTNAERYLAIARRFFAPDEGAYVAGGDAEDTVTAPEDVKRRFFRIWTAKEAFVKYTGEGIATGFETFSVLDDTEGTFFSVSQDLDVEEAGAQKRTSLLCS